MAISDLLKSNLRQIRSFKNMAPRILRHFKNKAAVNENWTTVFEKTETDSFYGADSQGIYITAMLFPKHQFEAQAEMKFSEAPKHFRSFLDCPVSIKHTNIIVGHVKEIKFDDDGMWGKLYIYAPMNNQNYLEKQREIKEGIMSGKYKQISIAYDMDIDENGNKRWFPVEMSVVEDSRVEVGNFKRVSFSKKIGGTVLVDKKDPNKVTLIFDFLNVNEEYPEVMVTKKIAKKQINGQIDAMRKRFLQLKKQHNSMLKAHGKQASRKVLSKKNSKKAILKKKNAAAAAVAQKKAKMQKKNAAAASKKKAAEKKRKRDEEEEEDEEEEDKDDSTSDAEEEEEAEDEDEDDSQPHAEKDAHIYDVGVKEKGKNKNSKKKKAKKAKDADEEEEEEEKGSDNEEEEEEEEEASSDAEKDEDEDVDVDDEVEDGEEKKKKAKKQKDNKKKKAKKPEEEEEEDEEDADEEEDAEEDAEDENLPKPTEAKDSEPLLQEMGKMMDGLETTMSSMGSGSSLPLVTVNSAGGGKQKKGKVVSETNSRFTPDGKLKRKKLKFSDDEVTVMTFIGLEPHEFTGINPALRKKVVNTSAPVIENALHITRQGMGEKLYEKKYKKLLVENKSIVEGMKGLQSIMNSELSAHAPVFTKNPKKFLNTATSMLKDTLRENIDMDRKLSSLRVKDKFRNVWQQQPPSQVKNSNDSEDDGSGSDEDDGSDASDSEETEKKASGKKKSHRNSASDDEEEEEEEEEVPKRNKKVISQKNSSSSPESKKDKNRKSQKNSADHEAKAELFRRVKKFKNGDIENLKTSEIKALTQGAFKEKGVINPDLLPSGAMEYFLAANERARYERK